MIRCALWYVALMVLCVDTYVLDVEAIAVIRKAGDLHLLFMDFIQNSLGVRPFEASGTVEVPISVIRVDPTGFNVVADALRIIRF